MNISVDEELKTYIDPLTDDEHAALERSILAEGCRDALVLWGDVLVDGHNRYGICQKHGLPFHTTQNTRFQLIEDVHLWMIDQHLGRRSVSDFQRGILALRKKDIVAARRSRADAPAPGDTDATPMNSREAIARAARLSSNQVVMIEKIQKQASPELVAAVKSGTISINAAAAVATLPAHEQVAAAAAGKGELQQAAKRVREAKRLAREESAATSAPAAAASQHGDGAASELADLRRRVAELTAENDVLRLQLAALST